MSLLPLSSSRSFPSPVPTASNFIPNLNIEA